MAVQGGCALLAGVAHRLVGLDEPIAHGLGPELGVEFDQRLEFAHGMGVAQGMVDLAERAIGNEAVVHNDAALEVRGDRGPRFSSAR